jgi:branched-subunit amino acid transport protein
MNLWLLIVLLGGITFLERSAFFLGSRVVLSPRLQRGLRFLPAALLTALLMPSLVLSGAPPTPGMSSRLIAGGIAAVVAWRTRRVLLTVVVGMSVLWSLQWIGVGPS